MTLMMSRKASKKGVFCCDIFVDISKLPLFKLPPRVWKNTLVPFWYTKAHKAALAKEQAKEDEKILEKHHHKHSLFKIATKEMVGTHHIYSLSVQKIAYVILDYIICIILY